jgi:hypothetical protein
MPTGGATIPVGEGGFVAGVGFGQIGAEGGNICPCVAVGAFAEPTGVVGALLVGGWPFEVGEEDEVEDEGKEHGREANQ